MSESQTAAIERLEKLVEDMRTSFAFDKEDVEHVHSAIERLRESLEKKKELERRIEENRESVDFVRRSIEERGRVMRKHEQFIDFKDTHRELGEYFFQKHGELKRLETSLLRAIHHER